MNESNAKLRKSLLSVRQSEMGESLESHVPNPFLAADVNIRSRNMSEAPASHASVRNFSCEIHSRR